jgi:circadian clock protein KaiB
VKASQSRTPPPREAAKKRTRKLAKSVGKRAKPQEKPRAKHGSINAQFLLRLYVTGFTPTSTHAIEQVRALCEAHLPNRYKLDVIDLYQVPSLAREHQIVATPTLIKELPGPLRRFIGDLSAVETVLFGSDLRRRP